jgi:RNA polymerase sigma-70 factor (ECF subfamily)
MVVMNAGNQPQTSDKPPGGPIDWASTLIFHERWLRTVVAARLGERQAVDEVMQEVSLAAVKTSAVIDPARVAGWLYRLAIRKTLLYRRGRGRQHRLVGRYAERVRDQDSSRGDPLGWLLLDERLLLVRQAMGKIPSRDAEILLLKYTENWSCRDLAEHLGQSDSAIESRLFRARQRLRDELVRSSLIEVRP